MKLIEIENIKNMTSQLFVGTVFDELLVMEATFSTAATFTIDGHINSEFIGKEEMQLPENAEGLIRWGKVKPICFSIIKGNKVPRQFKIIFKMPDKQTRQFLQESSAGMDPEQINGLFLNINYKDGKLYCTTGTAIKTFSMDKNLDLLWDEYMIRFLKQF